MGPCLECYRRFRKRLHGAVVADLERMLGNGRDQPFQNFRYGLVLRFAQIRSNKRIQLMKACLHSTFELLFVLLDLVSGLKYILLKAHFDLLFHIYNRIF